MQLFFSQLFLKCHVNAVNIELIPPNLELYLNIHHRYQRKCEFVLLVILLASAVGIKAQMDTVNIEVYQMSDFACECWNHISRKGKKRSTVGFHGIHIFHKKQQAEQKQLLQS